MIHRHDFASLDRAHGARRTSNCSKAIPSYYSHTTTQDSPLLAMFSISALGASVLLFTASIVQAQSPPGSQPSTNHALAVKYNGNLILTPNALLPQPLLASAPAVSLNQTLNGTHMLMLVDLAIPQSSINGTGSEFYPGLVPCRTTRLHWLQTGLTQSANGTFVSDSAAIADYGQPHPGLNDIAHTYTFYLFRQPSNFTLPSYDAGRVFNPISVSARMNFSVTAVADVVGAPLAANYMRVINPNTTAPGSASNGTCPTGAPNGTVTPYTGAATKLQGMASAVVVVLSLVVFALL
ncbi:hypothetical protein LTR12_015904 [Friedmanniomyces endolithicus]|nr:hypothetical protein LTR12_015904 [Friedmanniomyces endolithicus]